MKKKEYLNPTDYARLHKVCRSTVIQWIANGRIEVDRPAKGVVLIDKATPRPEKLRSWHTERVLRTGRK